MYLIFLQLRHEYNYFQMLLESGLCQHGKSIVITEPRKISAITLATRVAQEQKTNLGQSVGYSVRFDNCCQPSTQIKVSNCLT